MPGMDQKREKDREYEMQNTRNENYQEDEYINRLKEVLKEHPRLRSLRYFINQMRQWYRNIQNGQTTGRIVILGTAVPEELVMAAGEIPFRILGGSRRSCDWSDDLVPRDTDPVSRSVLGYVQCLPTERDLLYIVPTDSDSMRKTAYQLRLEGRKVFPVDIPPIRGDADACDKWTEQMFRMMETAAQHVHGKITAASLQAAVRMTSRARICLHEFTLMAPEFDGVLSPTARLIVQNSYYYADDPEVWTMKLRELMHEIRKTALQTGYFRDSRPRVLLMGSPLYFPNDKIPRLLDDSGLCIWRQEDAAANIQNIIPKIGKDRRNLKKMIGTVARTWYRADTSGAYLKNEVMRRRVRALGASGQIEGVVFHVLKGQIGQDFELAYCEELLEKYHIPVFRLETDYQYQDVEQLRIRMEAFTEMLSQNRTERKVV